MNKTQANKFNKEILSFLNTNYYTIVFDSYFKTAAGGYTVSVTRYDGLKIPLNIRKKIISLASKLKLQVYIYDVNKKMMIYKRKTS